MCSSDLLKTCMGILFSMPIFAIRDEKRQAIGSVIAPSINYNQYLKTTLAYRHYFFPDDQQLWLIRAMKTFSGLLAAALLLGAGNLYAADYTDGNLRKNDNRWLNLNLYDMSNTANAFGPTYDNTYLEVEGGARSGALDLYYFFDINEILGWGMEKLPVTATGCSAR